MTEKLIQRQLNLHCKSRKLIDKYFLDLRNMFLNQENIRIFFSKQENAPH